MFGVILIKEQYYFGQNIRRAKERTKPCYKEDKIFVNLNALINFLERDIPYTYGVIKKKQNYSHSGQM